MIDNVPETRAKGCSVALQCSSEGIACRSSDRACQDRARAHNLEVTCDVPGDGETVFVYCPKLTNQRDSSAVWLLFVVAVAVALIGSAVLWLAMRKRR
jgi:hypothetical protein